MLVLLGVQRDALRSCHPLINRVDVLLAPEDSPYKLDSFPVGQAVMFSYYRGKLRMLEEDFSTVMVPSALSELVPASSLHTCLCLFG